MQYVYYVAQEVQSYGRTRFYEAVRDVLVDVLETNRLDVFEHDIRRLYEDFGTAYIIAAKSYNPELLKELLTVTAYDENVIPGETVESITFLSTIGDEDSHLAAICHAADILQRELQSQTGLAALINSMFPGSLTRWIGETFSDLVLVCYETIYGNFGSVSPGTPTFAG